MSGDSEVQGVGAGAASRLPADYLSVLERLKREVRGTQMRAVRSANVEVLALYWSVGHAILDRQQHAGWGSGVVDRLAADLRAEFPEQRGWSRRNLLYMRALAAAFPDRDAFVPQAVAQLPWGHVRVLLDKTEAAEVRSFYADRAVRFGWSRAVLEHQVATRLHERDGKAPSNFAGQLPPADSDLAQQLVRDPYVFDHLTLTERVSERELEQALMDRLQATLLEFGHGMAFVGRQVRFEVGGDELVIDLMLFHIEQLRYIVVELKVGRFEPAHVGQLGAYVALVDDKLRRPDRHAPTIGLLLVTDRNEQIVRYALGSASAPMAVATYTTETVPDEARRALPTAEDLRTALDLSTLGTPPSTSATTD